MGCRKEDGALCCTVLDNLNRGEPFFVLRAQDTMAATVVRVWCMFARIIGSPDHKVDGASEIAHQMDIWGRENETKVPD